MVKQYLEFHLHFLLAHEHIFHFTYEYSYLVFILAIQALSNSAAYITQLLFLIKKKHNKICFLHRHTHTRSPTSSQYTHVFTGTDVSAIHLFSPLTFQVIHTPEVSQLLLQALSAWEQSG